MAKPKLDLHDIYNRGDQIDAELNRVIEEAIDKKIELVEIIPGKGSGQLKKKVLRFLNQGHIKKLYHAWKRTIKILGGYLYISSIETFGSLIIMVDLQIPHQAGYKYLRASPAGGGCCAAVWREV